MDGIGRKGADAHPKLAPVALMREMLTTLNALLRTATPWNPRLVASPPPPA